MSGAPTYPAIDAEKASAGTKKGQAFSCKATLDTPEMPKASSKGLLGSRWASNEPPASPSSPYTTIKYPDPSTLEPVYRSEDWLSDLSAEYQTLSVKGKNTSQTAPAPTIPAHLPVGMQIGSKTKPPTSESQQRSGQNTTNQEATPMKPAGPAGPTAELGRTATTSEKPVPEKPVNPSGIFNDSAFKDWYNTQFMRRKA
jgi:hypothetical protein